MRIITTRNTVTTKECVLPAWVEFALRGEKINAIKALRTEAGLYNGEYISLMQAKMIVESFSPTSIYTEQAAEVTSVQLVL